MVTREGHGRNRRPNGGSAWLRANAGQLAFPELRVREANVATAERRFELHGAPEPRDRGIDVRGSFVNFVFFVVETVLDLGFGFWDLGFGIYLGWSARQGVGSQPDAFGSFLNATLVRYGCVKYCGSLTTLSTTSHVSPFGSENMSKYSSSELFSL